MNKEFKYAKYNRIRKYPNGGNINTTQGIQVGAAVGGAAGNAITNNSYNSQGVNKNQYVAGNVLSSAAAGAGMGAVAGPIGALVGGGLGAAYGLYKGITGADDINEEAEKQRIAQEEYDAQIAAQKAEMERQQQDAYNKAYYSVNPIKGNQGVQLYMNGGKLCKYPNGGKLYNPNNARNDIQFQNWYNRNTIEGQNKIPFSDTLDYDYYSFYKSGSSGNVKSHFPDTYKRPNHKTFSNESLYSIPENIGGSWDEDNYIPRKANGGTLKPLASGIVKAEGATHAEGGIKLANNQGKPFAEVEDQEIIKNSKVYSDRITLPNSNITIAMEAEKLAKMKGKHEKYLLSPNYREKNSAERTTQFADAKLNELFNYQEASKNPVNRSTQYSKGGNLPKYGDGTRDLLPTMDDSGDDAVASFQNTLNNRGTGNYESTGSDFNAGDAIKMAVPYIDNIYNANLINKTPNIPIPTVKEAYYAKAMPMKTSVNVSNELSNVNDSYRNYVTDVNQNTSSSNVVRGNNLAALATTIKAKNSIYQNKNNIETQLINANQKNIQDVNTYNMQNAQNIANTNLAQKDSYNMSNMYRTDDINRRKSMNVSDAVNNATTQIQDSNMKNLDQERIVLDSLKYGDAAGMARLIGTPSFDKAIKSNKDYYSKAEKALIASGQTKALDTFYRTYGKPK